MVRCYDCGQPVPDEFLVRRYIREQTAGWLPTGTAYRSRRRRVNLCRSCARSRDIRLLGCVVVAAVFLLPITCIVTWGRPTHTAPAPATTARK